MSGETARTKQQGLQQAASMIFALVAVVPLLIFAWTLHSLGAIRSTQAQLSLGLALGVALLGFWMFRSLLSRMAEVVQALAAAVEQASRTGRRGPVAASTEPVAASAEPVAAAAPTNGAHEKSVAAAAHARAQAAVTAPAPIVGTPPPRSAFGAGPQAAGAVAGIGKIRELTEVAQTMDALWYREARAHLNQRVQISVANSREPLVGTLTEVSGDGLILEQPEGPMPVAYGRVTSIDRLSS
jgi:hypothetical protein